MFPDTAAVLQKIQAARTDEAAHLQKWHAELNSLEQRRIQARSALPGLPQRSRHALPGFHPRCGAGVRRRKRWRSRCVTSRNSSPPGAVARRRYPQDRAWRCHPAEPGTSWAIRSGKAQLAPIARGSESDALRDVALIQSYIQEVSKLAPPVPFPERNALQRVYARAPRAAEFAAACLTGSPPNVL